MIAALTLTACAGTTPPGEMMQNDPKSSCAAALAPVLLWDLASFRGLAACTRTDLASALGLAPNPGEGRSRLGRPARTWPFVIVPMAGSPRGAKVWLDGEQVLSILIELPPISDASGLLSALGEPAARLDWQWDVVAIPGGERVWASRGLTLALDRAESKVVRAYLYAPTDVTDWTTRLRPSDTVREEP